MFHQARKTSHRERPIWVKLPTPTNTFRVVESNISSYFLQHFKFIKSATARGGMPIPIISPKPSILVLLSRRVHFLLFSRLKRRGKLILNGISKAFHLSFQNWIWFPPLIFLTIELRWGDTHIIDVMTTWNYVAPYRGSRWWAWIIESPRWAVEITYYSPPQSRGFCMEFPKPTFPEARNSLRLTSQYGDHLHPYLQ